jgi:serralysin
MRGTRRAPFEDGSDRIVGLSAMERQAGVSAAVVPGSSMDRQIDYIAGIDSEGRLVDASYWSGPGDSTAFKFGTATAGTGATVSWAIDPVSRWGPVETATIERALAMWSAVADITFVRATNAFDADLLLQRGFDEAAYARMSIDPGSGTTLGQHAAQAVISIDPRIEGFDLTGSLEKVGGYGFATLLHEIGHTLGLGHAGPYNGSADPTTQQRSAYDNTMYTTMSYFSWFDDLRYRPTTPVATDWGYGADGYYRTVGHTVMQLDIEAIQRLYGAPEATPLGGGVRFGYNSNIAGPLRALYDFDLNGAPIVTLFATGRGNVLDLSGAFGSRIDLNPGAFSSTGGYENNIAIALNTVIETAIGGDGSDSIIGSAEANRLYGMGGFDYLVGGAGDDLLDGGDYDDRMTGGAGDDLYIVNTAGDQCIEKAGEGHDTVRSLSQVYRLSASADIEVLIFIGNGDARLGGSGVANEITGGIGDDVLTGNGGADTLRGGAGDDTYETDGIDRLIEAANGGHDRAVLTDGSSLTLGRWVEDAVIGRGVGGATLIGNALGNALTGGTGADRLHGGRGDDILAGGSGNDWLDGGAGADRMDGGEGNNTYLIDAAADVIVGSKRGMDSVIAEIDYVLAVGLENLTLTGDARAGTGNGANNRITGSRGADTLKGLAGNDRITGGDGADVLTGGRGADRFVFDPGDTGAIARRSDLITDFARADKDKIDLSAFGEDLHFIGLRAFSGTAGEVQRTIQDGETRLRGDLDGDGQADFVIRLAGEVMLFAGDLIL